MIIYSHQYELWSHETIIIKCTCIIRLRYLRITDRWSIYRNTVLDNYNFKQVVGKLRNFPRYCYYRSNRSNRAKFLLNIDIYYFRSITYPGHRNSEISFTIFIDYFHPLDRNTRASFSASNWPTVPTFLFQVVTRPWSPDQGKTREMTKLCNHKRKLLLPTTAAASPVASCTPAVSSSALSAGPGATAIHVNADSPTSPDKARKGKSVTSRVPIPSSPLISTYLIDSLSHSLFFRREADPFLPSRFA